MDFANAEDWDLVKDKAKRAIKLKQNSQPLNLRALPKLVQPRGGKQLL